MELREIQTQMSSLGLYPVNLIDGKWGPKTQNAIRGLASLNKVSIGNWSSNRMIIAAGQILCRAASIEVGPIDGLLGPQTRYAFEVFAERKKNGGKPVPEFEEWRDKLPPAPADAPVTGWPRHTVAEMTKFFGAIGANVTQLKIPDGYGMVLYDGPQRVFTMTVHEKIHDAVNRVLTKTLDFYGPEKIKALRLNRYFGCLNPRPVRGGKLASTHSWAAALDWDANNNQLRWNKTKATLARPEYEQWWRFWEEEKFVSLGRTRDFDWMHVQAARLA
jgi:peptidoglycan hydrolase-like protein with peptidoglycan-binding domain